MHEERSAGLQIEKATDLAARLCTDTMPHPSPLLLPLLQWATFPLLQLAFQVGDWKALLENRTVGATLHGANRNERMSGESCWDAPADCMRSSNEHSCAASLHCCQCSDPC